MKISTEGTGLVCVNFLSTPLFQGEIEGEEIELASIGVHHPQQGKARVSNSMSSFQCYSVSLYCISSDFVMCPL